jgi:hypothetical protein
VSIADRVLDAVKAAVLLEARVTSLAGSVGELARDVREIDKRLVRLETIVDMGTRGGPPRLEDLSR